MHLSRRGTAAIAAIIVTAGCTAAVLAQQAGGAGTGSLSELTSEIRQLRFAVEQSTRTQTEAQALGIFLSAQQSRILQVTTRLDVARKEAEAMAQQSTDHANHVAAIEAQLARVTDPGERLALEDRARGLKLEIKAVASREQQARAREGEIFQAYQQEEARWNDLIARLQQIIQR
jgi:hypothetical protein